MATRPDALDHPLFLSPRRGLDVNPFDPPARKRSEVLDGVRRPWRDRTFHLQHLALDLEVDVRRATLGGTATLTLSPMASGLHEVVLDASELRIGAVRLARGRGGRRLRARHDGQRLVVKLDRPYDAGEVITLEIGYRAQPRRGFWFVRPDRAYPHRLAQGWSQGQAEDSRGWFPCLDHPNDKFTSEVRVTTTSDLFAVSNGRLVARRRSGDGTKTTWHWRLDRPHPAYLVTLAVAPYVETRGRAGDVKLRYYAFAGQGAAARRLYGRTPDMVRFFASRYGPYPWGEYAQVVVSEFTWGGMENTGATTLTDKALTDARGALDVSYESLISHELAHQWFGDLVTCRGWHHNWLNESWATFSELLYTEHAHGADAAAWERLQKRAQYLGQDRGGYRRPIVFDRYVIPMDLFDRHAYEKGSLVLTMLRDELGDELFFRGARLYLARHRFGFADTHDFRKAMEDAAGRDLGWFFEQWLFQAGFPELDVSWRPETRGGRATGRVVVTVRQRQRTTAPAHDHEATPVFRFGLDLAVVGTRGVRHHRVRIDGRVERFALEGAGRPVRVAVDPGVKLLKTLEVTQPLAAWRHALAHDASFAERMQAARMLARSRGAGAADATALARALEGDASPHVRMAAAIALGELAKARPGTARAAHRALARAVGGGDPNVRRAAAYGLGLLGRRAEADLLAVLPRERSYLVKATALKALAVIGSKRLLEVCRAAMEDRGWRDLVPMAALDALAIAKPAEAFELGYLHVRYGETQEVREGAIRLLCALAGDARAKRARPEPARHVVPTVAELLRDPSLFIRLAAVDAAARLKDPSLIPALRRVVRDEAWDNLQRHAQKAIRALQEAAREAAKKAKKAKRARKGRRARRG